MPSETTTRGRPILVVANRAPVVYGRDERGDRIASRGAGGLVTALGGLLAHHDVTWIASAMSDEDRAVAAEHDGAFPERTRDGADYLLRLVAHDPAGYDRFYNVVANPTLWFLQHYLWGLGDAPDLGPALLDAWEHGYVPVNEAFAAATLAELERRAGAAVFFHDYHLYLAPRLVRARRPDVVTSHFVHIPWPQPDYWHALPDRLRRAVHEGLLANDVVGFHTDRWRCAFLECCAALLGAEVEATTVRHAGRATEVTAHPVGIDAAEFDRLAESPAVLERERELVAARPELLVLRVDRTDPSKNVVRGFRAFALLLERHPELHGRVGMLALLAPSRQDVPEYADYVAAVEQAVREVNDRFGRAGWTPVTLDVADDFPRSVAGYRQYDVLLVNPVFDGLNLVSKEAPLVNRRHGVLVLSENAGAHEEIGEWALGVNPLDLSGQADALHEALTMPADERRRRSEALREHVRRHDVREWIDAQLGDLDRASVRSSA
ncbi:MAG TPA: trehalose-6-phosphate synthase [Gaiellaceae bacterium]|nr:trehalose-6-phosphate synthase [Gaiellaceae bacterium]